MFYSLAAFFVWIAGIVVYQLTIAFVGESFGIRVREISIGLGPTVFRCSGRRWTYRFAALPFGGYTQFRNPDDVRADLDELFQDESPETGRFVDATPAAQMLTASSGPLAMALLGFVCLAIPVWAGGSSIRSLL